MRDMTGKERGFPGERRRGRDAGVPDREGKPADEEGEMEQLRIGICEDNREDRLRLIGLIRQEPGCHALEEAGSAEEMLRTYYPGKYDLLLLDIYMEGITGIEALRKIRTIDSGVEAAIVTNSEDFTLESYRLHAIRYLEKPVQKQELEDLLRFCIMKKEAEPHFMIESAGRVIRIPFGRIDYIEQRGRMLVIYRTGGDLLTVMGRLDEIEPQFPETAFFRCHKSYLVNLARIRRLDRELMTFVMEDGSQVHIRRQSLPAARRAYENWLFRVTKGFEAGCGQEADS